MELLFFALIVRKLVFMIASENINQKKDLSSRLSAFIETIWSTQLVKFFSSSEIISIIES